MESSRIRDETGVNAVRDKRNDRDRRVASPIEMDLETASQGVQQHPCSAVQHTRWCWRCLSVRDLLLLLCSFAMLSVYMSYRLTSLHLQTNPQDTASGLGDALQRNAADHGVNQRSPRDVPTGQINHAQQQITQDAR
ncbi:hypothetical protein MTO96_047439 [Rhipicephalus appendiculatus]